MFLESFVPTEEKKKITTQKRKWRGIERRITTNTGFLSDMRNMYVEYGNVKSCNSPSVICDMNGELLSPAAIVGFDDLIIAVYFDWNSGDIIVKYIKESYVKTASYRYDENSSYYPTAARSIVGFNKVSDPSDPLGSTVSRKLLLFPDKMEFDYDIPANGTFVLSPIADSGTMPDIKYATVLHSRLFGADDSKLYASEYNDYTGWNLDTAANISPANAWASTTQANTKSDGKITALVSYNGHVTVFKKNYTHQIYNTKNPFRILDLFENGAINPRGVCELDGMIYFVSERGVYTYGGNQLECISDSLGFKSYNGNGNSLCTGYDKKLYVTRYEPGEGYFIYIYDTETGFWSCSDFPYMPVDITSTSDGVYIYASDNRIYRLDGKIPTPEWYLQTDLVTPESLNYTAVKEIKLKYRLEEGASLELYGIRDSVAVKYISVASSGEHIVSVRLHGQTGHGYSIRIQGSGGVLIESMDVTTISS